MPPPNTFLESSCAITAGPLELGTAPTSLCVCVRVCVCARVRVCDLQREGQPLGWVYKHHRAEAREEVQHQSLEGLAGQGPLVR